MDTRSEIKEFLTSRRAKITPEQAGLVAYGSRRVPGLRREEVAVLAGVSVPYYTRLERGEMHGVSESVLEALARALQLDDAERAHLFNLARAAQPTIAPRRRRPAKQAIRPSVQYILDAITGAAAFVRNDRLDIFAANALGYALYSDMFAGARPPANSARFIFLDSRARDFYPDWNKAANDSVAVLRASAGRDPYDRCLSDLVGELSTQSDEFRTRWAQHNVRQHITGIKHFHHPVVGELSLTYDRLDLAADPGLTVFTYTAEPARGTRKRSGFSAAGRRPPNSPRRRVSPTRHDRPSPRVGACDKAHRGQDAPRLAELVQLNREFLSPWEPIRPDDYFTVEGQRGAIEDVLGQYDQQLALPHVILENGEVVGRVTLSNIVRGAFQSCHVGFWVSGERNGRGLATGAVGQIAREGFVGLRLHRIEAGTLLHNFASQRVLERNGFIRFGVAPPYLNIAGRWQDHAMFQLVNPSMP